jgi:nucleoid-associated protein YgaU
MRRLATTAAAAVGLAAALAALVAPRPAAAFPHVLAPGETLAKVAERVYGRVELEQVLVAANGLDLPGAGPTLPGMRLEVPAVSYHRASSGDTWEDLAARLLGDRRRADILARANDALVWVQPAPGRELVVPYNLRYVVKPGDSTMTIAYRFLGKRDLA